jgi:hypothetical protein
MRLGLIGDSFTEGQGASPWFYELEGTRDVSKPQIVNLGILGTGPKQWVNLASSTSKEFGLDVIATVVNIIPADMTRTVWMFKERELNCLYRASCNYVYDFQGYKFASQDSDDNIKRSVLNSVINSKSVINFSDLGFEKIRDFIKKSRVILDLYRYFHNTRVLSVVANEAAILSLKDAVLGNFYVNVVSQKSVNSSNYADDKIAKRLIDFLNENQIKHNWCDIPPDGFHKNDGHPNVSGYEILQECTRDALTKLELNIR